MGCCGKDYESGSCVCDVLKEINDVQNDITENCCDTSCEKSINDLLGEQDSNDLDTVPVLLYCKDGCHPFKGFGAFRGDGNGHCDFGEVVGSYYFRVKKVDDDCCAILELLRDPGDDDCNPSDPVCQKSCHLRATGICITVDANCFCHITCLPAISAFDTVANPGEHHHK